MSGGVSMRIHHAELFLGLCLVVGFQVVSVPTVNAQECIGQNCLPQSENPVELCTGENCTVPTPPSAPATTCTGQDCASEADKPTVECKGQNCDPIPQD
jgi:hypothetical protein